MDKIDLLLDAAEHPDRYSDCELEALLQDPATREAYDLICKVADAAAPPASRIDVDAEWRDFERKNFRAAPRFMTFFSRHAAAVITVAVAALAVVAGGIGISVAISSGEPEEICVDTPAVAVGAASPEAVDEAGAEAAGGAPDVIVYKEETLGRILGDMSEYYNVDLTFRHDEAKALRLHLRWDRGKPLAEVVEMLNNFEQIEIALKDNILTVGRP